MAAYIKKLINPMAGILCWLSVYWYVGWLLGGIAVGGFPGEEVKEDARS
jgi:hypothetical protein